MKISYLLPDLGKTGGYIVLYNFMDNLVRRGYKVFAITPEHSLEWKPSIWQSFLSKRKKTIVGRIIKEIKRPFKKFANRNDPIIFNAIKRFTKGLMSNWVKSDITISTYCLTSYANFYLSERTLAYYHMQHFEERLEETKEH